MAAADDLDRAATALAAYPEQVIRRGVAEFRATIEPRLKVDTGGDARLSGIGNAKLTVTGRVDGGQTITTGTVAAGPRKLAGPWRWLNDGVRPYVTAAGNRHPGSRAKRTFDDPVDRAVPTVERMFVDQFDRTV